MNQAKELFELQELETTIKTELNLECEILERSVDIPIDALAVNIGSDIRGRTRIASLMFIPLENSNIETLKLLQFFCETPICVESQPIRASVAEFLSAINFKIPLGTFCFDPQNRVTFKYIYALGKFTAIKSDEFLESFLFWVFTLDSMSVLIEEVAEGERSLESAIRSLEE